MISAGSAAQCRILIYRENILSVLVLFFLFKLNIHLLITRKSVYFVPNEAVLISFMTVKVSESIKENLF